MSCIEQCNLQWSVQRRTGAQLQFASSLLGAVGEFPEFVQPSILNYRSILRVAQVLKMGYVESVSALSRLALSYHGVSY